MRHILCVEIYPWTHEPNLSAATSSVMLACPCSTCNDLSKYQTGVKQFILGTNGLTVFRLLYE